ncbi:hypothetical protein BJY04DRAFT_219725 [Aspergillus karnatakaensis]|uniref:uncharacterized protein n=1 Tax=Aspergillus karnatakaensis TaxID=1810916 RepID=UPI003CCD4F49
MSMISDLVRTCLAQLSELLSVGDVLLKGQPDVSIRAWKDERSRLSLWAGNIGSHQTGQSSLDYRLRDASHIRNQIIMILEAIKSLLEELVQMATTPDEVESEPDDDDEIQALCEELDLDLHNVQTETQELYNSLVDKISQLFEISMTLRNPAQHDRLVGTHKVDVEPFKFHYQQHVSHKYPNADSIMVLRIGSAMARQKAILKYRDRHHQKLRQGLHTENEDIITIKLSETVATSFNMETVVPQSSDLASESGISSTSYAASLVDGKERVTIRPLPRLWTPQRAFECPYCYFVITIKDRRAWAKHVFCDLSPHICIFLDCSMGNKLYDSRKSWYNHIRLAHTSPSDSHGSESQICPLCKETYRPRETFEKHVGRHLEELSLFVLPRTAGEEEESNAESENRRDSKSAEDTDGPTGGSEISNRKPERAEPNTADPVHRELSSSISSESDQVPQLSTMTAADTSTRPAQTEGGGKEEDAPESTPAIGKCRPSGSSLGQAEFNASESNGSFMEIPVRERARWRTIWRRFTPGYTTTYLGLISVPEDDRIDKSGSTGARQTGKVRNDRKHPTAPIGDSENEPRNTNLEQSPKPYHEPSPRYQGDTQTIDRRHIGDETIIPDEQGYRQLRLDTSGPQSWDPSPLSQAAGETDPNINQKLLGRNHQKQDSEILQQQQENISPERPLASKHEQEEARQELREMRLKRLWRQTEDNEDSVRIKKKIKDEEMRLARLEAKRKVKDAVIEETVIKEAAMKHAASQK